MKKAFLALVLLVGSLSAQNLLRNPCFKGLKPWSLSTWTKVYGTLSTPGEGLLMTNTAHGQTTLAEQSVALKPDTSYRLSFRIKGEGISVEEGRTDGASIMILHKGKFVFECSPRGRWKGVSGTFDWKPCSFEFRTGKEIVNRCNVYLVLRKSTGKAWFTDLSLSEVNPTVAGTSKVQLIPMCWQQSRWNLAAGMPGAIYCQLYTSYDSKKNYEIELRVPQDISVVGANCWHLYYRTIQGDLVKLVAQEKGLKTYRIALSKRFCQTMQESRLEWSNYYRLFLESHRPGSQGTATFRFLADGKDLIAPQQFVMTVLPPISYPKEPMRRFKLAIAYLNSLTAPTEAIRQPRISYWRKLSERPDTFPLFRYSWLPAALRQQVEDGYGMIFFLGSRYLTPLGRFSEWQQRHGNPVPHMVMSNGKSVEWACPSFIVKRDTIFWNGYVHELVQQKLKDVPTARTIVWDVEPGAKSYCFCPTCRKAFSAFIKADYVLTAKEITERHAIQWFRFRVRQNAEVMAAFSQLCRAKFPQYKLVLCTDPLHAEAPHIQDWCGVDVRMNDHTYDYFMNMPYYQGIRWYDDLAFNLKTLKTPQYPLIDPTENMAMFYTRYTPEGVTMNLVAAAALGAKGLGFWPGDNFDGRYLQAISDGCRMIANGEDIYAGKRCDNAFLVVPENVMTMQIEDRGRKAEVTLPDFKSVMRHTVHQLGKTYMVTVFNYHGKLPLIVRIKGKGLKLEGPWQVWQEETRYDQAKVNSGFLAEIPASSVRQFTLMPGRSESQASAVVEQKELEGKLKAFLALRGNLQKFQPQKEGKNAVSWGVLPDQSTPLVKLSSANRAIYVNPARQGAIVGYYMDDLEDILAGDSRGVLDETCVYYLTDPLAYEIQSAGIVNGKPTLRLKAVVPTPENADGSQTSNLPTGLVIEKKISLEEQGKTVRTVYTLTNPGSLERPLRCGVRVKHYPRLGAAWKSGQPLSTLWTVRMTTGAGQVSFRGSNDPTTLFLAEDVKQVPGKFAGVVYPQRLSDSGIGFEAAYGKQQHVMTFQMEPQDLFGGILSWWSRNSESTVEPLMREIELKAGESRSFTSFIRIENDRGDEGRASRRLLEDH